MFEHRDKDYWLHCIKKEDDSIFLVLSGMQGEDRKTIAEQIIVSLRHFVQDVECYIQEIRKPQTFDKRYSEEEKANKYCKSQEQYRFLSEFLDCLNSSIGHQSILGEYAERLIQKYFYYLIKIKKLLQDEFQVLILQNLEKYPLDLDQSFLNYYRKILLAFKTLPLPNEVQRSDQYYVQKKKALFIDNVLFYEYTLTNANDSVTKFDRFTAFSLIDIYPNYCVKVKIISKEIRYLDVNAPYFFIVDYSVSIRPCEFDKLGKIVNLSGPYGKTKSYLLLMDYIKNYRFSLNDLFLSDLKSFNDITKGFFGVKCDEKLYKLLSTVRDFVQKKKDGWKTILYLTYHLNNSILQRQLASLDDNCFGDTNLSARVFPFEKNPFSSSLISHRPKLSDLCSVFPINEYRGEYLARVVSSTSNNTETLFLPKCEILTDKDENDISEYSESFTKSQFAGRKVIVDKENVYLQENKDNTEYVIRTILNKTQQESFPYFSSYISNKIVEQNIAFDDPEKKNALLRCFDKKSVFVVYGPAGSGKSYFTKYLVDLIPEMTVCCIALTNPAVDNIRQKIGPKKAEFCTINAFLKDDLVDYDLLIIDECSTIGTRCMKTILEHGHFKMLLLCGDIYQIQSIEFGNWFSLLRYFVDRNAFVDFNNQFRSHSEVLKGAWDATRSLSKSLQEIFDVDEISHQIDDSIFIKQNDDEIVLCLNYDGLYGINNIDKIIQCKNPNPEIKWKQYTFKVGDPILFYETKRFSKVFHNNLKGRILGVYQDENKLYFKVSVNLVLSSLTLREAKVKLYEYKHNETIVGFSISKPNENDYDYDSKMDSHIPFQIAYAVSIHKAQGLEFDSVKIVISNEVEEKITHNIFYTAITRAKKHLTIYWSPETERKVINNFNLFNCKRDANILRAQCISLKNKIDNIS